MIPLLPEVQKALEQELAYQQDYQQELEVECAVDIDGISDFVFLTPSGKPQSHQTINRVIKGIYSAYNLAETELAEKEKREPQLLPHFSCHGRVIIRTS